MIKARHSRGDGHVGIDCLGHAPTHVCSAASMIMQSAALGLRDLAKQYPKDFSFEGYVGGDATDAIDSTDKRRKRRSR